jgi:dienelactone hydrolase
MQSPPTGTEESTERCEVVLFHSVLGLRPGVMEWADRLREAGHRVHTPDLYSGEVFDDLSAGMGHLESIGGIGALIERSQAAVAELPRDVAYAGFSNGGGSAELLALSRPGAVGVVLMHAALPVEAFGCDAWPSSVPLQIHYAEEDPCRDPQAIASLARSVSLSGADIELWYYPGSGHLFADPGHPDFEAGAAESMFRRCAEFLGRLPAPGK